MIENETKEFLDENDNSNDENSLVAKRKVDAKTLTPIITSIILCAIAVITAVVIINQNNRRIEEYNAMLASERAEEEASERAAEERARATEDVNIICDGILDTSIEYMNTDSAFGKLEEAQVIISQSHLSGVVVNKYNDAYNYVSDCKKYKDAMNNFYNAYGGLDLSKPWLSACGYIDSLRTDKVKDYFWQENQILFGNSNLADYAERILRKKALEEFRKNIEGQYPEEEILDVFYIDNEMYRSYVYDGMQEVLVFCESGNGTDNYDFYYKSLSTGMLQQIDAELEGSAFICRFSGSTKYAWRDFELSVVNVEWENGKIVFNVKHHDNVSGFSGPQISSAYFMGDIIATSGY